MSGACARTKPFLQIVNAIWHFEVRLDPQILLNLGSDNKSADSPRALKGELNMVIWRNNAQQSEYTYQQRERAEQKKERYVEEPPGILRYRLLAMVRYVVTRTATAVM